MGVLIPELLYRGGSFEAGLAVEIDEGSGRIGRVLHADAAPTGARRLRGRALVPGFVNAHSHAFQRLLRGQAQWRSREGGNEDFWSWRSAMYAAALALEPDDVFVVSRFCFLEMLRAGWTSVGEFHYLHRDPAGGRYADATELSKRVIEAAESVGLRIRLLYVAYARGGIGEGLRSEQRRFATPSIEECLTDLAALAGWASGRPRAAVGVAAHSIRAVPAEWLAPLHEYAAAGDVPFHIHAAEQPAEVAASEAVFGRRPIELLAERGVLDERTTVVHATHVNAREIELLSGSRVCACPTTERDLGDGFLQAEAMAAAGVDLCLGSDSHVVIDPLEEMRLVEYHERLRSLRRVVLAGTGAGRLGVAPTLIGMGTAAGARALRFEAGEAKAGALADLVAVDLDHPALAGWAPDTLAAMLALSAPIDVVRDVWVGGEQRIADGHHALEEEAATAFREVARRLS